MPQNATPEIYGPDDPESVICFCGHPRYEHKHDPDKPAITTCLHGWGQHESHGIAGCGCPTFRPRYAVARRSR